MYTDYSQKINFILQSIYSSVATQTHTTETIRTIEDLYLDVISILPEKWVYHEDVLAVVNNLDYKIQSQMTENNQLKVGYQLFVN